MAKPKRKLVKVDEDTEYYFSLGDRFREPEWHKSSVQGAPVVEGISAGRVERAFWDAFGTRLLRLGWMPEEIELLVTSSSVRHALDEIDYSIERLASKMADSLANERESLSGWLVNEIEVARKDALAAARLRRSVRGRRK